MFEACNKKYCQNLESYQYEKVVHLEVGDIHKVRTQVKGEWGF